MASALSSPLLTSIALTSIKLREFNLRDVNLSRHKPRKQCVAEGDKRPRFDFIVSDLSINGRDFFFQTRVSLHCWVTQWGVHLKLCRLSSQIQSPHRYRRQVSYGVSALGRDHAMGSRSGLQLARVQCSSLRTPSLGCPRERARSSRHLPLLPCTWAP